MIVRRIFKQVKNRLKLYPAVCLVGPRQCGKTTLAKQVKGLYFDLEMESDWVRLNFEWPNLMKSKKMVILDEAQTRPELFARLRHEIDQKRQVMGRFLLLGSLSPSLMQNVSDSLAGRISYLELTPFILPEVQASRWKDLWFFGGFPDGGILKKKQYYLWQKDYLTSLTAKDLPDLGLNARPSLILKLISFLASVHGGLWNASQLGKSLGLSYHTVNQYVSFLEEIFLIRRLPSYVDGNLKKRIKKAPKLYLRDSGLLHFLHGLQNRQQLMKHHIVGLSFEGFVIEQVLNHLFSLGVIFEAFFFQTSDHQHEVDLMIKRNGRLMILEVKMTSHPDMKAVGRVEKVKSLLKADQAILICNIPKTIAGQQVIITNIQKVFSYLN